MFMGFGTARTAAFFLGGFSDSKMTQNWLGGLSEFLTFEKMRARSLKVALTAMYEKFCAGGGCFGRDVVTSQCFDFPSPPQFRCPSRDNRFAIRGRAFFDF
jgi:hypothetical protein